MDVSCSKKKSVIGELIFVTWQKTEDHILEPLLLTSIHLAITTKKRKLGNKKERLIK